MFQEFLLLDHEKNHVGHQSEGYYSPVSDSCRRLEETVTSGTPLAQLAAAQPSVADPRKKLSAVCHQHFDAA